MKLLGLSMNKVKAVFISHEHTDHIRGLPAIAERFSLPVYITSATLEGMCHLSPHICRELKSFEPVTIGGLVITAFPKYHDAQDPHSFIISGNGVTVGVFTDIGAPCPQLAMHFRKCHAAFLEANYDEELLENGKYPYFLKHRIRGGKGHLSNQQAYTFFLQHRPAFMSHILLSHLSKDNNCPVMARNLFLQDPGGVEVIIASRYEPTPVYRISSKVFIPIPSVAQMSLF